MRIKLDAHDRRIFVPTPNGSPNWQRGYNRRSALERIDNRIDSHFGFEQHFIRGLAEMTTRVGLAIAVMMAMSLDHIRQGPPRRCAHWSRRFRRPARPADRRHPMGSDRGTAPEGGGCPSLGVDGNYSHL